MGARDLQLRFFISAADPLDSQDEDEVFTLDINGSWRWVNELTHKEAADDPLPVEQIRAIWTFTGYAQRSWTNLRALFAALHRRTGGPIKVQVVRDPGDDEVVELELGPDDWEDFRVEEISGGEPLDVAPSAHHRTLFPVSFRVSAVRRFDEDAGAQTATGIVQFEQTAEHRFDAGLQIITWETTVTTKKGTDAVAKAKTFGLIPISALGGYYTYLGCNGSDGVNWTILNADQRDDEREPTLEPDRVPTKVRATCTVRQWGVRVDVTAPGAGPDEVSLVQEEEENDEEKVRRYIAEASGPGAEDWVLSQAPSGDYDRNTRRGQHNNSFRAEWTIREKSTKAELAMVIEGELTGGYEALDWEEVDGYEPIEFVGPLERWELTLSILLTRRGGTGLSSELPFPPQLPTPWRLDRGRSSETEASEAEAAASADKVKWTRKARLVYVSTSQPSEPPIQWIRKNVAKTVPTYWLRKQS